MTNTIINYNIDTVNIINSFIEDLNIETCAKNNIIIIDFLNLTRSCISNRKDAKFTSINDFINIVSLIVEKINTFFTFDYIYLVAKILDFGNDIKYSDMLKIFLWSFCRKFKWKDKIILVMVNGINDNDKGADDRALFILYDQIKKTTNYNVIIISNDKFDDLKNHYMRHVVLNFYYLKIYDDNYWNKCIIQLSFKGKFKKDYNDHEIEYNIFNINEMKNHYLYFKP